MKLKCNFLQSCNLRQYRLQKYKRKENLLKFEDSKVTLDNNEKKLKYKNRKESSFDLLQNSDCFAYKLQALKNASEDVTPENQFRRICETVTPLYCQSYEEQLELKFRKNFEAIITLNKLLNKNIRVNAISSTLGSPDISNYRNKDEFSIYYGVDRNPKTVGFFIGSYREKNLVCIPANNIPCIKTSHAEIANLFQTYIQSSSLDACLHYSSGHWRNLIVRSNKHNEVMVIVIFNPQNLTNEDIAKEQNKFKNYFSNIKSDYYSIHSIYFQCCKYSKCSSIVAPFELLSGELYLRETILDTNFLISPDSFFQTNVGATEVMLTLLRNVLKKPKNKNILLLDLGCGTGVISLILAPIVSKCIGIDSNFSAIEDAKRNCELNNISNANFVCGKIEDLLDKVLAENLLSQDLYLILNPGRSGVGYQAIRTIMKCSHIRKLIYISCKPESKEQIRNFVQLLKSSKQVQHFNLIKAVPVDLFPQTEHCELILFFHR